jgi:hypothetical protein
MNLEFVRALDIEKVEKIRNRLEWFHSNYGYFEKYYPGNHFAIKDQKVLDCDRSLDTLLERLQIRDYRDSITIEFVYPRS